MKVSKSGGGPGSFQLSFLEKTWQGGGRQMKEGEATE